MNRPKWLTASMEAEALAILGGEGFNGNRPGRKALSLGLGITEKRARNLVTYLKGKGESVQGSDVWQVTDKGGEVRIISKGRSVTSAEEAIEKSGLDMAHWYVHETTANTYSTPTKNHKNGRITVIENWQIKVILKRRRAEALSEGLDAIADRIADRAPKYPARFPAIATGEPMLLEMSLCDHHFGKLAWGREVGADYDLKVAEGLFVGAVRDTLAKVGKRSISEILFPIGGDVFNYDNSHGETANGTRQDNDSRPAKVFEAAFFSVLEAIELAMRRAPVRLCFIPGNHDPTWSHHLVVALWGAFRSGGRVEVDLDPMPRKYIEFGSNLIGVYHGDMPAGQWKQLGLIMATEAPEAWARTKCREVHTGHVHTRRAIAAPIYDEHQGVVIRRLPSMTATDEWHFRNGYVGNVRLTESYLWGRDSGLDSIIMSYADPDLRPAA